ncbi:MAG: hypothetical protein IT325_09960 [Anaerolineae bacterium]|nr:hypothetical protein [Anaerolineae bacterium]
MNLDVNNSGAWKTVLRDVPAEQLPQVRDAVLVLVRAVDRHTFRLADGTRAIEYCEAQRGWYPSRHGQR